jgi:hypothetical protein
MNLCSFLHREYFQETRVTSGQPLHTLRVAACPDLTRNVDAMLSISMCCCSLLQPDVSLLKTRIF